MRWTTTSESASVWKIEPSRASERLSWCAFVRLPLCASASGLSSYCTSSGCALRRLDPPAVE